VSVPNIEHKSGQREKTQIINWIRWSVRGKTGTKKEGKKAINDEGCCLVLAMERVSIPQSVHDYKVADLESRQRRRAA